MDSSSSASAPSDWRNVTLSALRARNARESEPFKELISLHSKILERALLLQQENVKLTFQVQRRRDPSPSADSSSSVTTAGGDANANAQQQLEELKSKVYTLQEELTELHRRKGENAQQVIDLSAQVKAHEKDLNDKAKTLLEQEDVIEKLQADVER